MSYYSAISKLVILHANLEDFSQHHLTVLRRLHKHSWKFCLKFSVRTVPSRCHLNLFLSLIGMKLNVSCASRGETVVNTKGKKETPSKTRAGQRKLSTAQLSGDFLGSLGEEMDGVAVEYSSLLEGFIAQLPVQQHVDLKFLSFRLDFSEFYTRQHMGMSTTPIRTLRTPVRLPKPSFMAEPALA